MKGWIVQVNDREGRVLIARNCEEEFRPLAKFDDWCDAFEYAMEYADARDYAVEWFMEDQLRSRCAQRTYSA